MPRILCQFQFQWLSKRVSEHFFPHSQGCLPRRQASRFDRHGAAGMALNFYEKDIELSKELFEAYPKNVDFKNDLAISYYKLGAFSRDQLKDVTKARSYFQQAEKYWVELEREAPEYAQFNRFLDIVRRDLANLE